MSDSSNSEPPFKTAIADSIISAAADCRVVVSSGSAGWQGPENEFALGLERGGCLWSINVPLSTSGIQRLELANATASTGTGLARGPVVKLGGDSEYKSFGTHPTMCISSAPWLLGASGPNGPAGTTRRELCL
jgi:hypothetical protein